MADTRLLDLADLLLDNLVAELSTAGIEVPSRQYRHVGEVAHDLVSADCASAFVVSYAGTFQGTFAPNTGQGALLQSAFKCMVPLTARFSIVLLRCVPTLSPNETAPSVARLMTSSEEILLDAMTLPAVIIDSHLQGVLLESNCKLVGLSEVRPIGPFGAAGGCVVDIFVELT